MSRLRMTRRFKGGDSTRMFGPWSGRVENDAGSTGPTQSTFGYRVSYLRTSVHNTERAFLKGAGVSAKRRPQ
jgi:hypothetical protein